ncbi:hypothetical protein [Paenibacillus sp. RC67]|uniref:hypothetical protein n=1 Tax=Paenibacillus sp. RC67 TaxID=3039392 RepID=UPI0024ACD2A9|nr:hypothetical protein [Paenibacillus sp. RC67]
MSLGHDASWVNQALAEDMPAFDEARLRSGAVYDDRQNLWLVVTDKPCTVEQFRSALIEKLGKGRLLDGIFLDGDGSSQMNTAQKVLKGDSREVYQILALKRK